MKKTKKYHFRALATTGGISTSQAISFTKFDYVTNNYAELMSDSKIDLIVVATQHNSHAKFVIDSLEANKNVYCEKPLCLSKSELNQIKKTYYK